MPANHRHLVTFYTPGLARSLRRWFQTRFDRLELVASRLDRFDADVDVCNLAVHGWYEVDAGDFRNYGERFWVVPGIVCKGCAPATNS